MGTAKNLSGLIYPASLKAAAISSAIILRLLFSMKKLGPAWR
jgi:hypothetical protein